MIICARTKSYDDIKDWLQEDDKIILMTCNICVKGCGIGGRRLMDRLAKKLDKNEFNVIHSEVVGFACNKDLLEERRNHSSTREIFAQGTVIIPLACGEGIHNIVHTFPEKRIFEGIIGLGVGSVSAKEGPKLILPFESTLTEKLELPFEGIKLKELAVKLGLQTGGF